MSSSPLIEVRYASLKRPRSDSTSSLVAMPPKVYRKKAGARGLYRKRKVYRRLSLTAQLNRAQNAVHDMVMSGNISYAINGTLGFQLAGSSNQSLSFVFNELGIYYSLGGATPSAAFNFGNAGSYATVFDQWRLNKVICQVYFTSNSSAVNQSAQLPTIYSVTDVNDAGPLNSVNSALSYGNCRILQMGNSSGPKNGLQTVYLSNPTVEEDALTTSGTVLTAAGRRSPWLNCDNTTIQHNAFKMFTETPGGTNVTLGYVTFIFRCFYSFKNII